MHVRGQKRKIWCCQWIANHDRQVAYSNLLHELRDSDTAIFTNYLRMSKTMFDDILHRIRPYIVLFVFTNYCHAFSIGCRVGRAYQPPLTLLSVLTFVQWLNYSKVGGGTLHFVPSLPFPSLPQSSPSFPSSHPLRSRPPPFQRFWESAQTSSAPAEIVFGAFKA